MSRRTIRATRARACTGKQAHSDRAAALRHLASLRRAGGTRLNIYACRHCSLWHVGHTPSTRLR